MPVNGVDSDRNYQNIINGNNSGNSTDKVYNAVFGNSNEDKLSVNDFFNLMVTQLTNQDFMNPVDDTQYLAQMAQFSTMQEMMELCEYSKQNYVMSILGKEVTVSKYNIGGGVDTKTGIVDKISLVDNEYKLYVDGIAYDMNQVMHIGTGNSSSEDDSDDKDNEEADKNQ